MKNIDESLDCHAQAAFKAIMKLQDQQRDLMDIIQRCGSVFQSANQEICRNNNLIRQLQEITVRDFNFNADQQEAYQSAISNLLSSISKVSERVSNQKSIFDRAIAGLPSILVETSPINKNDNLIFDIINNSYGDPK